MIAFSDDYVEAKRIASECFRVRARMKPSEWAEQNRVLKAGTTPRPGRWRNDYLPWIAPILDSFTDNRWADGTVTMKPAQGAGSEIHITLLGYLADRMPGPMIYLCKSRDTARKFSIDRFAYMIENSKVLKDKFLLGKKNGETILQKEFAGGSLSILGAGSAGQMVSNPARWVMIDEEDLLGDFKGMGSARSIAEKRTAEYGTRIRTGIFSWAHPTFKERGVALTYYTKSDQREWVLVCPHCTDEIVPNWTHVEIPDRDPTKAVWYCPQCGCEITDQQRFKATREGRFVSQLGEDHSRRYVGFHFSKMCHPAVSIEDLAADFVACTSESMVQVFWNMHLGLPYTPSSHVLTTEAIMAKVDDSNRERMAPADTRFITCGIDVQSGSENIVNFYVVSAWTMNGNRVDLEYGKILGWDATRSLLSTFRARLSDRRGELPISVTCIDHGWKTRQVYDFCRSGASPVRALIPVKHEPGITPDNPTVPWRGTNPMHPELGAQTRIKLCRDYWMDRAVARISPAADPEIGGAAVLPLGIPIEVVNQLKAARQVEVTDTYGFTRRKWSKEKGERDDFLQATVYAEVAAVLIGLDDHANAKPADPMVRAAVTGGKPESDSGSQESYIGSRGNRADGRPFA